jgi:hypothetical protein
MVWCSFKIGTGNLWSLDSNLFGHPQLTLLIPNDTFADRAQRWKRLLGTRCGWFRNRLSYEFRPEKWTTRYGL